MSQHSTVRGETYRDDMREIQRFDSDAMKTAPVMCSDPTCLHTVQVRYVGLDEQGEAWCPIHDPAQRPVMTGEDEFLQRVSDAPIEPVYTHDEERED